MKSGKSHPECAQTAAHSQHAPSPTYASGCHFKSAAGMIHCASSVPSSVCADAEEFLGCCMQSTASEPVRLKPADMAEPGWDTTAGPRRAPNTSCWAASSKTEGVASGGSSGGEAGRTAEPPVACADGSAW